MKSLSSQIKLEWWALSETDNSKCALCYYDAAKSIAAAAALDMVKLWPKHWISGPPTVPNLLCNMGWIWDPFGPVSMEPM